MGINSLDSQFRGFRGVNIPIVPTTTLEELAVEGYPLTDSEYFLEVEGITGVHHDILEQIKDKYGFDREQVVKILLMPKYKGVTTLQLQEEYITNPAPKVEPTAAELADIKKKEDQKKMLMYGGIGLGVLVLGGIIWYAAAK